MVHRCHGSVCTSARGSRFDTISVQQEKEKKIYYARFIFIYFEQTVVQITFFFCLDVKILNIILNYNIIYIKSAVGYIQWVRKVFRPP